MALTLIASLGSVVIEADVIVTGFNKPLHEIACKFIISYIDIVILTG